MGDNEGEARHYSSKERMEMGRELRKETPRQAHAEFQFSPNGRDPIALLEASNQGRVPHLIPIRYGRMQINAFAFLRGSAALMAHDLSFTPASGIQAQVCGDCHLANFGLFATPERNLVFDLNDFDETLPAPWEWDVKRLAASFVVVGRHNGYPDGQCRNFVRSLSRSYRKHLRQYARMRVLDVWYSRLDDRTLIDSAPDAESRENRKRIAAKARSSLAEYLFPKITRVKDGRRRIVDRPPLVFHLPGQEEAEERLLRAVATYRASLPTHLRRLFDNYHFEDLAFKVVGVGSVGTQCYILLFLADSEDPLLLQAKEARPSVLEPYAGASEFDHSGERIVVGQRLMQSASDMFLGWITNDYGHQFYMRQLRDMKFSVPLEGLPATQLTRYAELCGWVLARAQAKGGDAAMISGYLGKSGTFDDALADFAVRYADQNERDYLALLEAIESGRLEAVTEE